jgi:Flp pilus assembly protein TadD
MTKLGVAIAAQGNVTDAIAVLRQAVALAPDNGWSERVLAEVLVTAGYLEDAAQHAERAIELAPSDPAAQDVLGVTLVLRRRPVEARRRFERALQLDSGYVRAREHIERLNASLYR